MLQSIGLLLLLGLGAGYLCRKCKLPALLGMLLVGILLGPHGLDWLAEDLLRISPDLRKVALIIILTRAGLGLELTGLRKIGRPALLLCFLPATFELCGVTFLGHSLLGLSVLEAAVLGAVLAAVSPAVVVPRMVKLMETGYGVRAKIPHMILAGASVDDVYVIVLFSTFLGMLQGEAVSVLAFVNIPVSIVLGIGIGLLCGRVLTWFFEKFPMGDTLRTFVTLCISILLTAAEDALTTPITFSSLIAIMFLGIGMQQVSKPVAKALSGKYNQLWVAAEVFLFVLVGATVDISYLGSVGLAAVLVILGALLCRMLGVFCCLLRTGFTAKERLFAMIAYCPKATVQAAIGGVPLAIGLACGHTVLTVAVLAIVVTAPLGAFAIDGTYRKLLTKE